MKKILILAAAAVLCACGGNAQKKMTAGNGNATTAETQNAENKIDYVGIYKGTLPAADCPGIETTLDLNPDGQFILSQKYLERTASFEDSGKYKVEGNLLTLKGEGPESYYRIEENRLRMLDPDKKEITGPLAEHYILTKTY